MNASHCGLPLMESCFETNALPIQKSDHTIPNVFFFSSTFEVRTNREDDDKNPNARSQPSQSQPDTETRQWRCSGARIPFSVLWHSQPLKLRHSVLWHSQPLKLRHSSGSTPFQLNQYLAAFKMGSVICNKYET